MFFELEDVRRRHTPYYDVTNVNGWVDTPDSGLLYNWARGFGAALPAFAIGEIWKLWRENWHLLRTKYEPPANAKQFGIYTKQILKMENFKLGVPNRLQYATMISLFDYGLRWGVYRSFTEGIYKQWGSADAFFYKRIIPVCMAAFVTSPLSVPFEIAKACYYGDKTYPKHLQKGYTSPFNALMRIPREEGPWYLWKGAFPIILRNFMSFSFLAYFYDFLIDKFDPLRSANSVPETWIRAFCTTTAAGFGVFAGYPWGVTVRNMVELHPTVDGRSVYAGNYRKAAAWLWFSPHIGQFYVGFGNHFVKHFPTLWLTTWFADSLGLFTYHNHDFHTIRGSSSYDDNDE